MNLSDAIDDLAPPPPPCFVNRIAWIEYLKSCAQSRRNGRAKKIIIVRDGVPQINPNYRFCADCTQIHSLAMSKVGKCQPDFLKSQVTKKATA